VPGKRNSHICGQSSCWRRPTLPDRQGQPSFPPAGKSHLEDPSVSLSSPREAVCADRCPSAALGCPEEGVTVPQEAVSRPPASDHVQFLLHLDRQKHGSSNRFSGRSRARTRSSDHVHPRPSVPYEHMFPSLRTFALAQQALAAFRLSRSFLLLEDDDCVDWEVDRSEPAGARPPRAPLRERTFESRGGLRRPGQAAPAPQVCTSPVGPAASSAPRRRKRDRHAPHEHERRSGGRCDDRRSGSGGARSSRRLGQHRCA
jgi:hypothetical protein